MIIRGILLNAYYDQGKGDGYSEGYATGYSEGLSNSSAAAYNITIHSSSINTHLLLRPYSSTSSGTVWTATSSGRLDIRVGSGTYGYGGPENEYKWTSVALGYAILYHSDGTRFATINATACYDCAGAPNNSFNVQKGDYIVATGSNPNAMANGGIYFKGTFTYATVD